MRRTEAKKMIKMASLAQQLAGGLRCPPLSNTHLSKPISTKHAVRPRTSAIVSAVAVNNAETRERLMLRDKFEEAYERCRSAPTKGLPFTLEDFHAALSKYDFNSEMGTRVKGTVFWTDEDAALVDTTSKSSAYLPVEEASLYRIRHVEEAGIVPGVQEEFVIIGQNEEDDGLMLSLKSIQYELAWERCRQLQAADVMVMGTVIDGNNGGVVVMLEGLLGFVPFSQISSKSETEELLGKQLPLKFVEVVEEEDRIVLSNRKAMADSQAQLGIGTVVVGTVESLKPYGAFIDIGGMNGLLHVSQISHDRVSDISTVLQPGDTLKVMILSHDRERGRVSLSTKKLEPTPGDMIRNPSLVFEKAEEMAQTFRQRIAQAEAMARQDMLRFQPESGLTLSSDGILAALRSGLPAEGFDLIDIPPAVED